MSEKEQTDQKPSEIVTEKIDKKEELAKSHQKDKTEAKIILAIFGNLGYFLLWGFGIFAGGFCTVLYLESTTGEISAGLLALFLVLGSFLFGVLNAFTFTKEAILPFSLFFSALAGIYVSVLIALVFKTAELWAQILFIVSDIASCITIVLTAILFSRLKFNNKIPKIAFIIIIIITGLILVGLVIYFFITLSDWSLF